MHDEGRKLCYVLSKQFKLLLMSQVLLRVLKLVKYCIY